MAELEKLEKRIETRALFDISYGLYIVSSRKKDKLNGQIANAVMQITGEPACLAVCLNKANLTPECVDESGVIGISVLEQDVPMTFIGQFGFKCGRDLDKFADVTWEEGVSGAPLVTDWSLSVIDGRIVRREDVFTHVLYVVEVTGSRKLKDGIPLTYADYHLIKKGKSPKTAPTFAFNTLEPKK